MTESTARSGAPPPFSEVSARSVMREGRGDTPIQGWLRVHEADLVTGWMSSLRERQARPSPLSMALIEEFVHFFVSLAPLAILGSRGRGRSVWNRLADLYGSFAALRGLAAGEAVEEMQLLRGTMLKVGLGQDLGYDTRLTFRDVWSLNRVLDAAVTHTSVGYTDTLFFQLLESSGVPAETTEAIVGEVRDQLVALRGELEGTQRG